MKPSERIIQIRKELSKKFGDNPPGGDGGEQSIDIYLLDLVTRVSREVAAVINYLDEEYEKK